MPHSTSSQRQAHETLSKWLYLGELAPPFEDSLDSEQVIYHSALQLGREIEIRCILGNTYISLGPLSTIYILPCFSAILFCLFIFPHNQLPQLLPNWGREVGKVTWVL